MTLNKGRYLSEKGRCMASKAKNDDSHLVEVHRETKVIDGDDCCVTIYRNVKTGELVTKAEPVHAPTDHWVIVGDCATIMPEIPCDSVDMLLTSPPYFGSKFFSKIFPNLASWEDLIERIAREGMRVLQDGRIFAIVVGDLIDKKGGKVPLVSIVTSIFVKAGFKYRENIIWRKPNKVVHSQMRSYGWQQNPYPIRLFLNTVHESILLFQKGHFDISTIDPKTLERSRLDAWEVRGNHWHIDCYEIDNGMRKPENERKIASFPDEIAYRLIKLYSFEGGTILDPFAGSGTVMKMARKLYRHSIGIEVRRDFVPVIKEKCGFTGNACTYGTPDDTFNFAYRGQRKRPRR